jgi:acetylornithine deacetylase/succinyl-diaminopimelate desuccinylase-like protein
MDLLALSRELIAANTVSSVGTAAAVAILKPLFESIGLEVRVLPSPAQFEQQNILGTVPGGRLPGLLLVTHLDTVDPGPIELWTETHGNPLALTQKGDAVFGLGSADTKLDALCKLLAVGELRGRPLRRSVQLLGTHQEEVGGLGAHEFIASPLFQAPFVCCSEPSELTLIRAHKGYAVVDVRLSLPAASLFGPLETRVFEGKSAHSSTPHLGINAIEKALEELGQRSLWRLEGGTVVNKVPARCTAVFAANSGAMTPGEALEVPDGTRTAALSAKLFSAWREIALRQKPETNPAFDPAHSVVNWGVAKIDGPCASLSFDCRLLPGHAPETLTSSFGERATELARPFGARVEVTVSRASPAMELVESSELLGCARAACREVGLDDAPRSKPTNTEAGIFHRAGAQAIVFGPGRSTGNAHCANEHNLYSQMKKAIEFYRALIARLCQ